MRKILSGSLLLAGLMASSGVLAQELDKQADSAASAMPVKAPPAEAVLAQPEQAATGDAAAATAKAETVAASPTAAVPSSIPQRLNELTAEQRAYLAANPQACELFVYTAPNVVGVKKASGLAKIAAVALPAVGGAILGSAVGPAGFEATKLLQDESTVAANRIIRDRKSDVPPAIFEAFTPDKQINWLKAQSIESKLGIPSAPAIFNGPELSDKNAVAARYAANGNRCINVVKLNNIAFEHSANYKSELATVITTSMYYYNGKKTKPKESVDREFKSKLRNFDIQQVDGSSELTNEIATIYGNAVQDAVKKFAGKLD